jgi:hypothetical protein
MRSEEFRTAGRRTTPGCTGRGPSTSTTGGLRPAPKLPRAQAARRTGPHPHRVLRGARHPVGRQRGPAGQLGRDERDAARRDERGAADQLVSRCSTKGSPGARTQMRSGFSTRSGNESGSALNGGKSGASTQPQWYSSNGVWG